LGAALVLALIPRAGGAAAQMVEFHRGTRGEPRAEEVLERVLARGRYRVIARDTILAAGEAIAADVIVVRATLRVEGEIGG
ncbi:MAG: hypothetical protein GWN71_32280, partial [Gammaproteobacteria bacterium]|nr:hypothetical protein [Gammaproteobacteria bacterium]